MGSFYYLLKLIFLLILTQILIPRINLYSQTDTTKIKSSLDYSKDSLENIKSNSIQSLIKLTQGVRNSGSNYIIQGHGSLVHHDTLYKFIELTYKDTLLLYLDGLKLNSNTNNDIEHYLKTNNLSIKCYILEDNITHKLQEKDYFPTKKEKELYPTFLKNLKETMSALNNIKYKLKEEIDISYCKPGNLISIYLEIENTNKIILVQFISIENELYFLQSKFK